jgi:hypothetical protein
MSNEEKLAWFGGNTDALNLFHHLVELIHIWDDLIDKDKPVSDEQINKAFLIALVYMPSNPFLPCYSRTNSSNVGNVCGGI